NPASIMGATKRLAELVVQQCARRSCVRFACVRFGNVMESRGSVLPLFKRQIAAGGPVTITHPDVVRYFMTIPEAVQLILQAGTLAQRGETYVLDMGDPRRIIELARDLIELSGLCPEKDIRLVVTGLRPGEKFREELCGTGERLEGTAFHRLKVIRSCSSQPVELRGSLRRLQQSCLRGDPEAVRRRLAQLGVAPVPQPASVG
ncbi:MAG: polysaccharide biosynthesis protein, partial [Terriglobia bacterium]